MSESGVSKGLVFLIHGMFSPNQMADLKAQFEEQGYDVCEYKYVPLIHRNINTIVSRLQDEFRNVATDYLDRNPNGKIHFVTQSYGGRVLAEFAKREAEAANDDPDIKKRYDQIDSAVMFAPPLGGTPIADFWRHWSLYLLRPIGNVVAGGLNREMETKNNEGANFPPQPSFATGVIAGIAPSRAFKLWSYNWGLDKARYKGKHDSLVTLENANPNYDPLNPRWDNWSAQDNFRAVSMGHDEMIEEGNPMPTILHYFDHHTFNDAPMPRWS